MAAATAEDTNGIYKFEEYRVDAEKNLYKEVDGESKLLYRLKKRVYGICKAGGAGFLLDTFGDCFKLGEEPVFICGTVSQPRLFYSLPDSLVILDSYSRIWIFGLDGTLLNIKFLEGEVERAFSNLKYTAFVLANKGNGGAKILAMYDPSLQESKSMKCDVVHEFADDGVRIEVDHAPFFATI